MTITVSRDADHEMVRILNDKKKVTGKRMTKQQFIEGAIMRELARVRGENPENVPDAPDRHRLAQLRRRGKV